MSDQHPAMAPWHRPLIKLWRAGWAHMPAGLLPARLLLAALARRAIGLPVNGDIVRDATGYADWVARHDTLTPADRAAIAAHIATLPASPLISVVMPAYNTPERLLMAAIASVRRQLWPHWELCVVDDASPAPRVAELLRRVAAEEPRVRWVRRASNGHIAAATNTALEMARGAFVAFLDHDDVLAEHALYEMAVAIHADPEVAVLYSDEDKIDSTGARRDPYLKPDFDPDLLLGQNLLNHLTVIRRDLVMSLGGLREGFEGSQDHDLVLRATRAAGTAGVRHIPAVLYHWRQEGGESFSEMQLARCIAASRRAVADVLAAGGVAARLEPAPLAPAWTRVVRPIPDPAPLVSVIVPTRDRAELLAACAEGVLERTDYPAIEFIVVDNDSVEPATHALFERLRADPRVRILPVPGAFNYSRLNNLAAEAARGDILLLLNNDIDVIGPDWLREMVSHAIRPDVGAVGAKLLYADGAVQHGGVVLGAGGVAGHDLLRAPRDDPGRFGSLALVREVGAVTGACLALRREVYAQVGGLDATALTVAFNDVDLCLKIRAAGLRILFTPFAELFHLESASRGSDMAPEKALRFASEVRAMQRKWGAVLAQDPFYSVNLALDHTGTRLAFPPRRTPPWAPFL